MKIAAIQMDQIVFRRVRIELDTTHFEENFAPAWGTPFDFEGVNMSTNVSIAPDEGKDGAAPGVRCFLTLRLQIDNSGPDERDPRYSPYLVDIEVGGAVRAMPGVEERADVEDLLLVNGTSLLWSAVREQVCNLTSRMPAGTAMLPTVNFIDLKQHRVAAPDGAEGKSKTPSPKRRASKKPRTSEVD